MTILMPYQSSPTIFREDRLTGMAKGNSSQILYLKVLAFDAEENKKNEYIRRESVL